MRSSSCGRAVTLALAHAPGLSDAPSQLDAVQAPPAPATAMNCVQLAPAASGLVQVPAPVAPATKVAASAHWAAAKFAAPEKRMAARRPAYFILQRVCTNCSIVNMELQDKGSKAGSSTLHSEPVRMF